MGSIKVLRVIYKVFLIVGIGLMLATGILLVNIATNYGQDSSIVNKVRYILLSNNAPTMLISIGVLFIIYPLFMLFLGYVIKREMSRMYIPFAGDTNLIAGYNINTIASYIEDFTEQITDVESVKVNMEYNGEEDISLVIKIAVRDTREIKTLLEYVKSKIEKQFKDILDLPVPQIVFNVSTITHNLAEKKKSTPIKSKRQAGKKTTTKRSKK